MAVIFSPSLGEIVNEVAGKYKEHLQAAVVLYSGIYEWELLSALHSLKSSGPG